MFPTTQIIAFALSLISVSLGRPLGSETPIRRVGQHVAVHAHVVRAQVVPQVVRAKVVARDSPANCSSCDATLTFAVSGTATATAAFTFTAGFPSSTAPPNDIGNFGSCPIPQIEFGAGFDGRPETSFRPVDQVSYNHPSADTIDEITNFICSALVNTCHADSAAQATCAKAQAAAAAQPPQEGIDADAFNAVFGIQTNFKDVKDVTAVSSASITSSVAAQSTSFTVTVASTGTTEPTTSITPSAATSDATTTSSDPAASISNPAASTSNPAASISNTAALPTSTSNPGNSNLQTFNGNLGGIAAPAVVVSGLQFQVVGNSLFKTKVDALARSCSVQQNDCADAANKSGNKGSFTVSACGTQRSACIAASGT